MTQDEIMQMAKQAGFEGCAELTWENVICTEELVAFAKLVAQHVRNTMNDEAKAHLEELRKNFNAESAELRLHTWSKEKQA
jgi:hypothetical protein